MKGPLYHVCTKEDHSIIFKTDAEFRIGINVLGVCLKRFPTIELYAFELMSNHFHFLFSGAIEEIKTFLVLYFKRLSHCFTAESIISDIEDLEIKHFRINTPDYCLNVISYINRNASVADPSFSPINYEWGTGRFFFNPEAVKRYLSCRRPLTKTQIRQISHSRKFDDIRGLYELDGYVSPLSFCNISEAQSAFSSPRQYMYYISKNVEATKEIAREIGESISYSDYDLYHILPQIAKKMFGSSDYRSLNQDEKILLSQKLHFEYNAGNKQICRILKIDIRILNSLLQ